MPSQLIRSAAFALAALLVAGGAARAADRADAYRTIVDAKVAYSGQIRMSNGKVSIEGSIAHRPGATRTHLGRTVIIHDYAREEWVQFLPQRKQYLRHSSKGRAIAIFLPPGVKRSDLRAQTVGRETVGGEKTAKIKLTFPTGEMTVWQTPDGIVVKMEGTATVAKRTQSVTMTLTELKRGPQDPALFAPPPGSTQLNAPAPKTGRSKPAPKAAPKKN